MENGIPSPEERRVEQVDIDEDILDYLVYKAVKSLLHDFQKSIGSDGCNTMTRSPKADIQLNLVDSFLRIYHASHPNHRCHPTLQFRIRLLRFVTIFTVRWSRKPSGSLNSSQHQAATISPDWIDQERMHPSTGSKVSKKGEKILPCTSLLETIPSFMALSAAANAMQESKITDTWMRLAAGYMAHAVVEQQATFGCRDESVISEAFGWGFEPEALAKEGSDDWIVNAMFLDEEEEFTSWKAIKAEHMLALVPQNGIDPSTHLMLLQENELSSPAFNNTILQFLKGLLQSLPKPILLSIDWARAHNPPKYQRN